jgi:putative hydrolase of the HAD superfamily
MTMKSMQENGKAGQPPIKNVIFDFGQVLVRFDPAYIVAQHTSDPAAAEAIRAVVFDLAYWNRLDAGEVTDEEAIAEFRRRLPPALCDLGEQVFRSWIDHLPPIAPMQSLVRGLRARGVPFYLLSNISIAFADRADEFPIFREFTKCIFSGPCHMAKPDPAIYRHLLRECGIRAEETLFIDDSEKNIQGAHAVGIEGYLFDGDAERLGKYLDGILRN